MRSHRHVAAVLSCTVFAGCGGPSASDAGAVRDVGEGADAPGGGRTSGVVEVSGCASLGTGDEICAYSFAWDPGACGGGPCTRLMIYFSGGQESCPSVDPPSAWVRHHTDAGYVTVCATDFETSDGSGTYPRHLESTRFDALVRAITSDPDIRAGWTGEDLLFSGVSHGASGPMIALSSQSAELQALWRGRRFTGACFYDGTYDAPGLLQAEYDQGCDARAILSYRRSYERYCPWPASAGLLPASWPTPSSCDTADTAADTIVAAPASGFGIHDFALVECGSGLTEFCGALLRPLDPADILPAAPIEALCDHLASEPGYSCDFVSHPMTGHVQCSIDDASLDDCNAWFRGRLIAQGITP